ncbi:hypothetical protein [Permianibacter aggregans]|uniref:Surface antigen-like protein n=1 Tax=Permianibacter aggregans TaxID=1510150 RepID=A0A4R6UB33_9GAMM|nr:hypothetical protein [Permianibacter aggregans]QGX40569.1 hypothetical protein E2H98_13180 [Permianibacter aggregans]TDQ43870.1 hypothetical protein EV696_12729 [Permianibacter aggregans]
MRLTEIVVVLSTLWFAAPALATHFTNVECPATSASDETGEQETAPPQHIGEISVQVKPIFDLDKPEENNWLFRGANALKISTDQDVVEDFLLFERGEPYNARLLEESERILRARKFLRDAHVDVDDPCAEVVNVNVSVKDVWTLLPDVSFSRGGGENSSRLGFRDSDFLGTGKSIIIVRKENNERTGVLFAFEDPNLFGSHNELDLQYQDNDDGNVKHFNLAHPFYSLDDRWTAGINFTEDQRDDTLYERGDEVQEFNHDEYRSSVYWGFSDGLQGKRTERWVFGYTIERSNFASADETDPNRSIPVTREYQYPWISWQVVNDQYIKTKHVNQMSQTEDINFGLNAFIQIGYADESFNSRDNATVLRMQAFQYRRFSEELLHYYQFNANSYLHDDGPRNQIVHLFNRFYYTPKPEQQWFANLELSRGWNLFVDQPLTIGGDSGLRGYPIHYQNGDHRVLFNLERRFYIAYDVWSLFDIGGAVYADYGRAWNQGEDNGPNGGWLADVGFGFRLSPTRTGSDTEGSVAVLHIDIATPLVRDDDPELDEWQVLVTLRNRF